MKITNFERGDKFRLKSWEDGYYLQFVGSTLEDSYKKEYNLSFYYLHSNDWELYQEPKKEKNKETWYQVVYSQTTKGVDVTPEMHKTIDDFYSYYGSYRESYLFEPKLINPVEIEYDE